MSDGIAVKACKCQSRVECRACLEPQVVSLVHQKLYLLTPFQHSLNVVYHDVFDLINLQ